MKYGHTCCKYLLAAVLVGASLQGMDRAGAKGGSPRKQIVVPEERDLNAERGRVIDQLDAVHLRLLDMQIVTADELSDRAEEVARKRLRVRLDMKIKGIERVLTLLRQPQTSSPKKQITSEQSLEQSLRDAAVELRRATRLLDGHDSDDEA